MLQKLLFAFCTRAERPMSVNVHREAAFVPITLNTLWDNPGARRWPKRLGRGSASGKGNSCGKGMRGQNSRSGGGVPNKFEGGQSPLAKRLPKWGAKPLQNNHREVNLCQVIDRVLQGRIDATKVITIKDLWEANIFKKTKFGVKLLARGANRLAELPTPLRFEVSDASKSAIDAIRAAGGEVTCIYRTPLLVHEHLYPEKYELELRDPLPCSRTVHRLQRIEDKGVEVVYQRPRWIQEQQAKQAAEEVLKKVEVKEVVAPEAIQKEKKQKKKKNQEEPIVEAVDMTDFKYPASREPGVGDNKIRKRKPEIYKQINLGLD